MTLTDPTADHEPDALAQRVQRRRHRYAYTSLLLSRPWAALPAHLTGIVTNMRAAPTRYLLHLLVVLLLPVAALASRWMPTITPEDTSVTPVAGHAAALDAVPPLLPVPLALRGEHAGEAPVPDSAFAEIDALAIPPSSLRTLDTLTIKAEVTVEKANLRGGPGTDYDALGSLPQGAALELTARFGDWLQARTSDNQMVWVNAELLNAGQPALDLLPAAEAVPPPPPPKIAQVIENNLNLRDGPGTAYVGLGKMVAGQDLTLLERYVADGEDWFQVIYGEQTGWVSAQYLRFQSGVAERIPRISEVPDPNPALVGRVLEHESSLRGGPGRDYTRLERLSADLPVDLLARYEDWFKVRTPEGNVGWMAGELVGVSSFVARRVPVASEIPARPRREQPASAPSVAAAPARPAAPPPAPAATAGGLVGFAMQFVGYPYVWGGASPAVGFDCSGFTQYVYAQYGVSLPHSAEGQFSNAYGTIISDPGALAPGDLVFFVNTYKPGISHVGIYIGGGQVVQAMSPALGLGVASIYGPYWGERYYGGVRP
jgi:cell wall-associated NlpC family hydrolase/uncharacterized protein YraI